MGNIENVKSLVSSINEEEKEIRQLQNDIEPYKKSIDLLDNTMNRARSLSVNNGDGLSINQLATVIQEICPALYFCLANLHSLNIDSSLAEQKRLEKYNQARESTTGTQSDKSAFAESKSQDEKIVADIYKGCYKDLDRRINICLEIVASYKKSLDVKSKELTTLGAQGKVLYN